jgi:hypothetical protein
MMLVDPNYRHRGIGRRLLETALAAVPLERVVRLDATQFGRKLYQEYGFVDEATLTRHVADATLAGPVLPIASHSLRHMSAADIPMVADEDRPIFGGDRRPLLEWALRDAPHYARVLEIDGAPSHYCFGRQGRVFDQIGPVIAGDDATAQNLVTATLAGMAGPRVAIDVFDDRGSFARWLRDCGFRVERPFFRMRRGEAPATFTSDAHPSRRLEYAILGPEFA